MPTVVTLAVLLQALLAAAMFVISTTVWFTGRRAQQSADAEVARQGFAPEVLTRHGIRFKEEPWEFALALTIGAILTTLAVLNVTGTARPASWIVEPLILVVVGFITLSQVLAVRYTEAVLRRSPDPQARDINARKVIEAARRGFPSVLRILVPVRFVLATAGSIAVLILLSVPAATPWFH
ncbi:hypothetical protein JK358_14445 [Nocardia sp. 2]|uniref:DUF2269 family protein n=1 Tax=Nocardia acididurans TaxID=2802282 RepID=A0ABS1M4V7_9NOCA|nr:hypothetical protein [Nocardia acididurans]MBL1075596.1 hypothetical protein [Nocardia acididurans]